MKLLSTGLIFLAGLIIWTTVHQYFFCPRFSFEEPKPFRGSNLYNPYERMQMSAWVMCNFHAHSAAWKGLTNGHGTAQDIWNAYDSLGYGIHVVSDYHKIDRTHEFKPNFIPAYEHGFNINKAHYLVLGDEVNWLDYPLPQIPSNKQWILNQLAQDPETLVILSHPDLRNGTKFDDVKYLSGYHCMEVLGPYSQAVAKWDSTLSAGKPIFLVGNDDTHNVFDKRSVGKYCTVVNAPTTSRESILQALKAGNSYGLKIPEIPGENFIQKTNRFRTRLPRLKSLHLKDRIIQLEVDKEAREIIFYGQHGKTLSIYNRTKYASYAVKESDPYVRVVATFMDGTEMYLNPIFRYADAPFKHNQSAIDRTLSKLFSLCGVLILSAGAFALYLFNVKTFGKAGNPPAWFPNPQKG